MERGKWIGTSQAYQRGVNRCQEVRHQFLRLGCLSGLNNRILFSHSSKAENPRSRFQQVLVSYENSLPGLQMASSCCVLTRQPSPCLSLFPSVSLSLLKKPPILLDQAHTLMTSCNLHHLLKGPMFNSHIVGVWREKGIILSIALGHTSDTAKASLWPQRGVPRH